MSALLTLYFDIAHAIAVHDWIIEHSGGRIGILNIGNLESPLVHIQNDLYYPEFHHKLTHLVFSINKNHAFNDGNKRASIALGAYFMELNGYSYALRHFVHAMENIAVWVADNKINKDLLSEIIESILYEEDFSEELKLRIIHATTVQQNSGQ